jgi:hypothetical protein
VSDGRRGWSAGGYAHQDREPTDLVYTLLLIAIIAAVVVAVIASEVMFGG